MQKTAHKGPADLIANLPWGTHCCHFYDTKKDLLDILVPYFRTGLLNNEFCIWVTSKPCDTTDAVRALRKALPKFDSCLRRGQIEILPYTDWYVEDGVFDSQKVLSGWIDKFNKAADSGYEGMRLSGDTLWLEKPSWKNFADYEKAVDKTLTEYRIKALCTYPLEKCQASEVIEVVENHGYALIKRGTWEIIENSQRKRAEEKALESAMAELEKRVEARTAELKDANRKLLLETAERKQAQEALRESEERFRLVLKNSPITVLNQDNDLRYTWLYNPQLGYRIEDVLGKKDADIFSQEDASRLSEIKSRVLETGVAAREEAKVTVKGRLFYWDLTVEPVLDSIGQVIGITCAAMDITERTRAEQELRKSRAQLRALAAYLQSVREEERTRIARELHDEIGQALTGIKLCLERNTRERPGIINAGLTQAMELANELIGRVRDLSLELRPAMLDDLGLLAALTWHINRYSSQVKIRVDFRHTGLERRRFEPEIETAAYRIVQEALTNVARHASVDKVKAGIWANEALLCIKVEDLGSGFDPDRLANTTGGLSGMRERATMIGGELRIESAPAAGTLLVAELPLSNNQQPSDSD
jgi:PAS domain S-box-containing protein